MKKAKMIILAGQSNAVGVGHVKCLGKHFSPEEIQKFHDGYSSVMINYYSHDKKSNGFVPVTAGCTEIHKDTVGPEIGMARYFSQKYPDETVYIVKCAFGGTSLFRDWCSPSADYGYDPTSYADQLPNIIAALGTGEPIRASWCYNELVRILADSISYLESQGYEPAVCGFCWMQGENDALSEEHAGRYRERYECLLSDLTERFADYFNGCKYVDAAISEMWTFYREINESKASHALQTPSSAFVDTISYGLTTKYEPEEEPDVMHYDSDSIIRLGELFAEQISL